jgi:WD40 repeat protein
MPATDPGSIGSIFTDPYTPQTSSPSAASAERAGPAGCEILGELGRGGMGVVYKARQRALDRIVALKIIRSGVHASDDERARFLTEARAAARLQHPNIVGVFEVGEHDGQPYCVLEYVAGGTLRARLAQAPLTPHEAAGLIRTLALAIHHAHSHGIIHRDLKPANILLQKEEETTKYTKEEKQGEQKAGQEAGQANALSSFRVFRVFRGSLLPKITDFGLARRIDEDSGQTRTGAILGTPSYMAPEQAAAKKGVGPAADIWALGAVLYECLTGRPPFRGANIAETLEWVRTREPVPPRLLQPNVPRDLETICLKCLQKEALRRYATAEALAADLGHFLAGEPIRARPVGRVERAWRWCRRNKRVAIPTGLAAVLLVVLAVGGPLMAVRQILLGQGKALAEALAKEKTESARREEWQARYNSYLGAMASARDHLRLANVPRVLGLLDEQVPPPDKEDLRGFEWYYLWRLCHRDRFSFPTADPGGILAFAEDGRTLVVPRFKDGLCYVDYWDLTTGLPRRGATLGGRTALVGPLSLGGALALAPGGRRMATADLPGTVQVWDLSTGKLERTLRDAPPRWTPTRFAFSADGRRLAAVGQDDKLSPPERIGVSGRVLVWDLQGTKTFDMPVPQKHLSDVALAPDGKTVVAVRADLPGLFGGQVIAWDMTTRKEVPNGQAQARRLAISPDGRLLAVISPTNVVTGTPTEVVLQDAVDGKRLDPDRLPPLANSKGRADGAIAFSPDGRVLAAGGQDLTVTLWNLATGEVLASYPGHRSGVVGLAWSPDGRTLASVSPTEVKVWEAVPGHWPFAVECVATSPDGRTVATGGARSGVTGGLVRLWDQVTGEELRTLEGLSQPTYAVAFSPDGKTLAGGGGDWNDLGQPSGSSGEVVLWDVGAGRKRTTLPGPLEIVTGLAFAPDGRTLAIAGKPARLWNIDTGEVRVIPADKDARVWGVAFSPDGKLLATGGDAAKAQVRVFDVATGRELATLKDHADTVQRLAFRPDGKTLATADWTGSVRLWDLARGRVRHAWDKVGVVCGLACSPDGHSLGVLSFERAPALIWKLRLLDPDAPGPPGKTFLRVPHDASHSGDLAFTPDGQTLVAGCGTVHLIDRQTRAILELMGPGRHKAVTAVAYAPDGRRFATAAADGSVRLLEAATGEVQALFRGHRLSAKGLAFSPDGKLLASGSADRSVVLWDVEQRRPHRVLAAIGEEAAFVVFSADGRTLVTAPESPRDEDYQAKVRWWDVATGRQTGSRPGCGPVAILPGDRLLLQDRLEKGMGVPNLRRGYLTIGDTQYPLRAGQFLALSADGRWVATAASSGGVEVWQPGGDSGRVTMPARTQSTVLRGFGTAAFSPAGKLLATADDDRIVRLWDLEDGRERFALEGLPDPAQCLAFAPDGTALAAAFRQTRLQQYPPVGGLVLWRAATPGEVAAWDQGWKARHEEWTRIAARPSSPEGGDAAARSWPPEITDNSNDLLRRYRGRLTLAASSSRFHFGISFRPDLAVDGNLNVGWTPHRPGPAWWEATFPEDVEIRHVTLLGKREAGSGVERTIAEFYDQKKELLTQVKGESIGDWRDFDFRPQAPVPGARRVRLKVQPFVGGRPEDVAVGEVLIE